MSAVAGRPEALPELEKCLIIRACPAKNRSGTGGPRGARRGTCAKGQLDG